MAEKEEAKAPAKAAPKTEPKTTAKKTTAKAPAKRTAPAKAGAWLGASNLTPRYGQSFSVSWRASEPVKLWQEGPDGAFHWNVEQRGSQQVNPMAAGKFLFRLFNEAGDELAALELTVKT